MKKKIPIDISWAPFFTNETKKPYYKKLMTKIKCEYESNKCFPEWIDIYRAFYYTSYDNVKIVILGQDPYHQPNQAHGLSFSVQKGVALPPSLQNIFKELKQDLNIDNKMNGCLIYWAIEGVLLLNATLTVQASKPNSHSDFGWQFFTDNVIRYLSKNKKNLVFILWGKFAYSKKNLIDDGKHLIITSSHPSPFSVKQGFLGSKPFSKSNEYLVSTSQKPINWLIQ